MRRRSQRLDEIRFLEWVAWLEANRRDHESLIDTSRRLLVAAAMESFTDHRKQLDKAAEMLSLQGPTGGARRSQMHRLAKRYGLDLRVRGAPRR